MSRKEARSLFWQIVRNSIVLGNLPIALVGTGGPTLPATGPDYDLTKLNRERVLGPLDAEVMDTVWQKGEVTVRDVYRVLSTRRELAYTTVMTVMRNLAVKGLLHRRMEARAHVYRATTSKAEFTQRKVAQVVDTLLDQFTEPTLRRLWERLSQPEDSDEGNR